MEIIVALVVIAVVGYWLYSANKKPSVTEAAPYKVETPVPAADVAPQPVTAADVPVVVPVVVAVEGAGAVEVPAAKPAKAKKAPAKKPAAVKAKAPAKKPTTAKKTTKSKTA